MGAYICARCDRMYCSHEVNCYNCEKCGGTDLICEYCWDEGLHEDQDEDTMFEICGDCFSNLKIKAEELSR